MNYEAWLNDPDIPELKKKRYILRKSKTQPKKKKKPPKDSNSCRIIRSMDEVEMLESYTHIKNELAKNKLGFLGIFPVWNYAGTDLGSYTRIEYRCRCGNKLITQIRLFTRPQECYTQDKFKYVNKFYVEKQEIDIHYLCQICKVQSIFRTPSGRRFKYIRYKNDFIPLCLHHKCTSYGTFGEKKVENRAESLKDENTKIYYKYCSIHKKQEDLYENFVFETNKCYICGKTTNFLLSDKSNFACKKHLDHDPKYSKTATKCTFFECEKEGIRSLELPWLNRRCVLHSGRNFFLHKKKYLYQNYFSLCTKEDLKHLFCDEKNNQEVIKIDDEPLVDIINRRKENYYFCEETRFYEKNKYYLRAMKRLNKEKATFNGLIPITDEKVFQPDSSFITFNCHCGNQVFKSIKDIASFKRVYDINGKRRYLSCLCINCQSGFVSLKGGEQLVWNVDPRGTGSWKRKRN